MSQPTRSDDLQDSFSEAVGYSFTVRQAVKWIDSFYAKPITLPHIAERLYVSPVYFSRIFKEETGISFKEYLIQVRMEAAKHLLESSPMTIQQVAVGCGYNNPNYFSNAFKAYTGISPSVYRKHPEAETTMHERDTPV